MLKSEGKVTDCIIENMMNWRHSGLNKSRGLREKLVLDPDRGAATDDQVPALIESDISPQAFRKNWARLIQKIYPAPAG